MRYGNFSPGHSYIQIHIILKNLMNLTNLMNFSTGKNTEKKQTKKEST